MFALFDPLQGLAWMFCFARTHAPFFCLKRKDAAVGGIVIHNEDAFILQDGLDAFDVACCLALSDLAVSVLTVKMKVEPLPMPSLSACISPPIISARRLLMASPRPVPPNLRVVDESACEKDWNRRAMLLSEMPMPVSRTVKSNSFLLCLS